MSVGCPPGGGCCGRLVRCTLDVVGTFDGLTADMATLPTGTVTFLLTDVERSTLLWQDHSDVMALAIARHYELLDAVIEAHGGSRPQEQGEGDSVVGAFSRASDALAAALDAQLMLGREPWPGGLDLRVRMGVHTGEAVQRGDDNYVGASVIRAARIRNAGHGGQVLVSDSASAVAGDALPAGASLVDLGSHRLKDLARPERLWSLVHADLPVVTAPLRTLDAYRHNLPQQPTPLIGRSGEVGDIAGELAGERLVTLTGAGGIGKTRLAAQVGADIIERFPGGVWWVDLAPLRDGAAIGSTLLAAIGASEDAARPALDIARDRLSAQAALVVFDNCEHVIADAATVIDELRAACPGLVVLATSREPLGLAGEVTWRVPSLSVPPAGADLDDLDGYDAVTLFLDRARRARPELTLDAVQVVAVVETCRRLDGIPLAIELAAARCRQLAPERIAAGLDERFRLLTGGGRTSLPRQQTLLASVAWSHDLLDNDERGLLRRLSVCAGTFRLGLAEALGSSCGDLDQWSVLDVLGRLVDKSLVQVDDHVDRHGHTETQYRLLETIRQYALDRAEDARELSGLRDAHADWWITELERIDARQPTWDVIDLVGRHLLDIRAALDWLDPDHDRRHRLLAQVALGWMWGGHNDDVMHYADRWLLAGPPDDGDQLAWAQAWCASAPAMLWALRIDMPLGHLALSIVTEAGDGRAALPGLLGTLDDRPGAGRRAAASVQLGIDDHCDVLLAGFCSIFIGDLIMHDPAEAVRIAPVVEAAMTNGRCPCPASTALSQVPSPPEAAPRAAVHQPDVEDRNDDLFLFDRFFHVLHVLGGSLVHGRADQFDANLPLFDRYPHIPIARIWAAGVKAIRKVVLDQELDSEDLTGLADFAMAAPVWPRRCNVRALVSVGGREQAAILIGDLAGTTPGDLADAEVRAVLALHDDEVVDAGRAVIEAINREADHIWIELRPDLLELAATVASRCNDHQRATILISAGERARVDAGVGFRFRDQQAWVDAAAAAARAELTPQQFDALSAQGASMSTDDALAYARRGSGERRRPTNGWDALTPTEQRVVELVAQGLTNPQIADRLIMGRATVKTHVSHCLTKLGLTSRAEMAAAAARRPT